MICQLLKRRNLDRSLAQVQQTSRSIYVIVTPILYDNVTLYAANGAKFFGVFDLIPSEDLHLACQPTTKKYDKDHPMDMPLPVRIRYNFNCVRSMLVKQPPGLDGSRCYDVMTALKSFHRETMFPHLISVSFGADTVAQCFVNWDPSLGTATRALLSNPSIKNVCLHYLITEPEFALPRVSNPECYVENTRVVIENDFMDDEFSQISRVLVHGDASWYHTSVYT